MGIKYRPAFPSDEAQLTELFTWASLPVQNLNHVKLVAERDGLLRGAIGISDRGFLTPLIAKSPVITLRLVSLFDRILLANGIKQYAIQVKEDRAMCMRVVRKLPELYKEIARNDNTVWYKRTLA